MRITNQHPDAHAAQKVSTWNLLAEPDGKGHVTYTNVGGPGGDYGTFHAFRDTKLEGMTYLLRTSGYCSKRHFYPLSDGSFACDSTQLTNSDVWVDKGKSCTATEYCIVAPAEFNVLQAVGIGCFTGDTAPY